MFERFTHEARKVVGFAEEEARSLNHRRLGTAHMLIAVLLDGESIPTQVLRDQGITLEAVRRAIRTVWTKEVGPSPALIPFTPNGKNALVEAVRESIELRSDVITPEHMLLGLLRMDDSMAVKIVLQLGQNPKELRLAVLRRLQQG